MMGHESGHWVTSGLLWCALSNFIELCLFFQRVPRFKMTSEPTSVENNLEMEVFSNGRVSVRPGFERRSSLTESMPLQDQPVSVTNEGFSLSESPWMRRARHTVTSAFFCHSQYITDFLRHARRRAALHWAETQSTFVNQDIGVTALDKNASQV